MIVSDKFYANINNFMHQYEEIYANYCRDKNKIIEISDFIKKLKLDDLANTYRIEALIVLQKIREDKNNKLKNEIEKFLAEVL